MNILYTMTEILSHFSKYDHEMKEAAESLKEDIGLFVIIIPSSLFIYFVYLSIRYQNILNILTLFLEFL